MRRLADFVRQRKPNDDLLRPIGMDRDTNVKAPMQPFVDPWDSARLFGNSEVVRFNGFNFLSVGVQIPAKLQSLFGIGELFKDVILGLQRFRQCYFAPQQRER